MLQRKATQAGDAVGEIDFLNFLEFLLLRRRHDARSPSLRVSRWSSRLFSFTGMSAPDTRIIGYAPTFR